MILKTCFCGATQKNFNIDIGPHFYADCCEAAGFDPFGNHADIPKVEKVVTEVKNLEDLEKDEIRKLLDLQGISHTVNHSKARLIDKLNRHGKKTE
jgi:hypothetical protein